MFSHHKREAYLPGWLWFFLILPLGLIVALLYRQKRLPRLIQGLGDLPQPFNHAPRYVEPDSIPLETNAAVKIGEPEEIHTPSVIAEKVQSRPDDLTVIEGIGPKISALLSDAGITTFRQLAETPARRIAEILADARLNRLADPETWPEQARLAANGRWDEFKQFQATLKAGRRPKMD